jgi:hypothetical protein
MNFVDVLGVNFPGVIPPLKGRGGKGERRGLGIQMGRRGVVWDREGEEGIRVIQGKGWEWKERRRKEMTWPQKQNSWIRHCFED